MRKKLTSRQFNLLFNLFKENEWLRESNRENALIELINLCENFDEQFLICDLLHRFNYLSGSEYSSCLAKIAEQIACIWNLSDLETQIVASAYTEDSDSSHAILYNLKAVLTRNDWRRNKLVSQLGKAQKHLPDFPNVVIVDEFAGTGETMLHRVQTCETEFRKKSEQLGKEIQFDIYVCLVACMQQAKELLESHSVQVHSTIVLPKGISDYYSGKTLRKMVKRMLKLESLLAANDNGVPIPNFGYERSESLFSTENGNTPNNVFPIFWWPRLSNGMRRNTVFDRRESD